MPYKLWLDGLSCCNLYNEVLLIVLIANGWRMEKDGRGTV